MNENDNDDYNNGVNNQWIKIVVHLRKMLQKKYSYYKRKETNNFPRILWVHRSWSAARIHREVFKALRFPFDEYQRHIKKNAEQDHNSDVAQACDRFLEGSDDNAFNHVFKDLTEENWEQTIGEGDKEGEYSYSLRVVNHFGGCYSAPKCKFCDNSKCENCPLPFSEQLTVNDLLMKHVKRNITKAQNGGQSSDEDDDDD
jgi:hypothetical protein